MQIVRTGGASLGGAGDMKEMKGIVGLETRRKATDLVGILHRTQVLFEKMTKHILYGLLTVHECCLSLFGIVVCTCENIRV